jgi:hypothetical protein
MLLKKTIFACAYHPPFFIPACIDYKKTGKALDKSLA